MSLLTDSFGRVHKYLRLSLTSKCNFKCSYCYSGLPTPPTAEMTFLKRLVGLFATQGVSKVRLTGGEPLLNPQVVEIAKEIKSIPEVNHLAITTNGLLLDRYFKGLVDAGLNSANISLDSLVPAKFAFIAKVDGFHKVWKAIEAATEALDTVKVNCVVMNRINDDEILDFVEIARHRKVSVRFIEFVPYTGNQWTDKRYFPFTKIIETIQSKHEITPTMLDDPVAKYYNIPGFSGNIGVIASLTEPFCEKCDRLRITSDGKFKVCLNSPQEVSLEPSMSDAELLKVIREELLQKPKEHGGVSNMLGNNNRPMTHIGG